MTYQELTQEQRRLIDTLVSKIDWSLSYDCIHDLIRNLLDEFSNFDIENPYLPIDYKERLEKINHQTARNSIEAVVVDFAALAKEYENNIQGYSKTKPNICDDPANWGMWRQRIFCAERIRKLLNMHNPQNV